jgi:hypothetical protein
MYDEREHESVRRRRKLADLFACKPGQYDNGAVERFANEDYSVPPATPAITTSKFT